MIRTTFRLAGVALLVGLPALAWNRAGHMVMGAVAYDRLQTIAPESVARVVGILRQHPQYESVWKPQVAGMRQQDQERLLFMLAARWPDDIRGNKEFDRPEWHYIDFPYRPSGGPASIPAPQPPADNLMSAFQRNLALVRGPAPDAEKAVALCWIFHLLGDLHQPLHTVSLFNTRFPEGDRGGNLFYIRPDPSSPRTGNLHAYWDNILLSDERFDPARELAARLEKTYPPRSERAFSEPELQRWIKSSFDLAVSAVYRKGRLKPGADRDHGSPLPPDYHAAAMRIASLRVPLAGYRLADFLRLTYR